MQFLVYSGIACLVTAGGAFGQYVFLSGDTNIGNPIDGSFGAPVDAGNATLFQNILGGGTTVVMHGDATGGGSVGEAFTSIENFYGASVFSGEITASALSGADLFLAVLPADDYTLAELDVMDDYVTGGGSIFFLGDNDSFTNENARINVALAHLGTGMSLLNTSFDGGFTTAGPGQIAADPFTAGMTSFTYAAPSEISGGTQILFGTGDEPFIAYVPAPAAGVLAGLAVLCATRRRR